MNESNDASQGSHSKDVSIKSSHESDGDTSQGHKINHTSPKMTALLSLGALGVVYGDIGTSPLYAMKECFASPHGLDVTESNVLGIVSLIFWSLTLTVSLKYLSFVMRADNHGEGGILALLALLKPERGITPMKGFTALAILGLFGAALLYGDGMITPSLSVLSAVEGLDVATSSFRAFIVPLTIAILVCLFMAQKGGTAKIGAVFGPTMLLWFLTIGALGLPLILKHPQVMRALDPRYALHIFQDHGLHGFLILGSVVLCITGGEALYADMGHFGRTPIRLAWYGLVFPALLLNYFGQGALLISDPTAAENPFYRMVSGVWVYPLVMIATVATVVASQALISGAFSLTQQAVQLGYWPRVNIVHTSGDSFGQIYVPEINQLLMIACIGLVLSFGSSTAMASAYGIAVTGTMAVTSILYYVVCTHKWKWNPIFSLLLLLLFLLIDLAFFSANAAKLAHDKGGLFPLGVGIVMLTIMRTWKRGRDLLYNYISQGSLPLRGFLDDLRRSEPHRVSGTAVFMTSNPEGVPPVLMHHYRHNKVIHKQVILLSITTRHLPEVWQEKRITKFEDLGAGFFQVIASYGFMQTPNVQEIIFLLKKMHISHLDEDITYFLGRETLLITRSKGMATWRKKLFVFLSRNARPANAFFRIPPNRVIELGTQVEL